MKNLGKNYNSGFSSKIHNMPQKLIAIKPDQEHSCTKLLLDNGAGTISTYYLKKNEPITITAKDTTEKYCQGWYDIETHQNYLCENSATVKPQYNFCYSCIAKTDFNPGFYNSNNISAKQERYNKKPHSVYIAYFGKDIFKAGILSDSRGITRLYEQGALFHSVIAKVKNAYEARTIEKQLIDEGLSNSVTKKQKGTVNENLYKLDEKQAIEKFKTDLYRLGFKSKADIRSNLDYYFSGQRPSQPIATLDYEHISGNIFGAVGKYLVVENDDSLFGHWLNTLLGYEIEISKKTENLDVEPIQRSLF